MTMPVPPRPPLPRATRSAALLAGAVAGAALGVGTSLVNLAVLVGGVLLTLGFGVGILTIMWGAADEIPVEELASGVLLPLAIVGVVGVVLQVAGVVASALLLRGRVPSPARVVAASTALTVTGTAALGLVSTAAIWPALPILGGASGTPWAIGLAVLLGLAGIVVGALVHWWMVAVMRARWVAAGAAPVR